MKSKKENEDFNRVQADLKANGFREKDVTIPSGKAMVLGIVYALPFVITLGLLYRFLLIKRAHLSDELPHLVRTVQKSPLAGNIKFLGGEASRQRRLSRF